MGRYRNMGKVAELDILVAGCGTGQHSITFAQSYPGAKVLAIDLSIASLSYAREKTRAMGLDNIEYAQADILELGSLGRTFDVISSGGVLHHLADMEKGWRALLPLLRPDGCMHVGLYSELARRSVVAGQRFMTDRGFQASDIRRARQELIDASGADPSLKAVLEFPDFYSTSDCRDLLFHVQESRCTVPQIARFLDENHLEFLGFSVSDKTLQQFRARFSRQNEARLNCWHEFETDNPETFRGMYKFWVQKRRG
jgi:SAM-dependent methyltransferase